MGDISLVSLVKSPAAGALVIIAAMALLLVLQLSTLGVRTDGRGPTRRIAVAAVVATGVLGAMVIARFVVIA